MRKFLDGWLAKLDFSKSKLVDTDELMEETLRSYINVKRARGPPKTPARVFKM